jgi:hypothetical protein
MDHEIVVYKHMEYYLATRNNDMGFGGKWMQLKDIMLSEVSQDQKHKTHVFSHTWKINPKISIHKNKHDHIQTQL